MAQQCSQDSALSHLLFPLLSFVLAWLFTWRRLVGWFSFKSNRKETHFCSSTWDPQNWNTCPSWTVANRMKVLIRQPEVSGPSKVRRLDQHYVNSKGYVGERLCPTHNQELLLGAQRLGEQKQPMSISHEDKESRRGRGLFGKMNWTLSLFFQSGDRHTIKFYLFCGPSEVAYQMVTTLMLQHGWTSKTLHSWPSWSQNSMYNFKVSPLYPCFHIWGFNQPQVV